VESGQSINAPFSEHAYRESDHAEQGAHAERDGRRERAGGAYRVEQGVLRLDARTKLLVLVLINMMIVLSPDLVTEWLCMGFIAVLLLLMGCWRQCLRGLVIYAVMMGLFYLCALFPNPLTAIILMLLVCFRKLMPIVFFASGFIASTKVSDLICAMQRLHIPKVIIIPFAVTLRFFPTLREEFAYIRDAMRLRGIGLSPRNIITRPLTVLECILVPLMLRCASIAEELSAAATTRGIDSDRPRSSLSEPRLGLADATTATAFVALITFVALGETSLLHG
jgi:energy-coupling factor transport system permease protein